MSKMGSIWSLGALLLLFHARLAYSKSPWDCDFEQNQCSYTFSTAGPFTYKWISSQDDDNVKPYTDHTFQQRGKGWYIGTSGRFTDTGVATMEARIKLDTDPHCLTFYAFQAGQWLSEFYVKLGTENLMVRTGENEQSEKAHEVWHRIEVDIPKMTNPQTLSFVVNKTQVGYSLTAIDDIVVTKGACSADVGPACSFERGLCGWKSWAESDMQKTSMLPSSTFSTFDHTLATKHGHFMFANVGGNNVAKTAALLGPALNVTGQYCMRFFYILFGDGVGTIRAGRHSDSSVYFTFRRVAPPKGKWVRAEVAYDDINNYQPEISYYSSKGKGENYFAIDDISFEPGFCPERMSITFESGSLDPWDNSKLADLKWSVVKAGMDSHYPPTDVTLGTNKGHVAFVTGSKKGNVAVLNSPYKVAASSSCMSFSVFVSGTDPGTISAHFNLYGQGHEQIWSWSPKPDERNRFVRAEFAHNHNNHYYFKTSIRVDMGTDGSWAIDDIETFSSQTCHVLPATANGGTAPPTQFPFTTSLRPLPKDGYYDCTFDKNLCHWTVLTDKDDRRRIWELTHGSFYGTSLPHADHTQGSTKLGQFLHTGTGYDKIGYTSVLESPEIAIPTSDNFGPKGCFSFWYYIWAPSGSQAQLKVRVITKASEYDALVLSDQTDEWTQANIDVDKNVKMKVHIMGTTQASGDDISIDDIVYTLTPCKDDQIMDTGCKFEQSDICGFSQDSKDKFDWQWHDASVHPSFADHNTNTKHGHMMLLQGAGHKVGDVATIISPPIKPMEGCLVFWLYGSRYAGKLKVSTKVTRKKTILSKHLGRVNNWVKVEVPLYSQKKFSLVFTGEVTSDQITENFLALDDMRLLDTDCETQGACSYEIEGLCVWYISSKGQIAGRRIRAMDVKEQIHPKHDHTLDLATGHFMFFNAKSHSVGNTAIYESPVFSKGSFQCMEFVLSNSGMAFSVYLVPFSTMEKVIFRTYKSTDGWKHIPLSVGSKDDEYVVRFVAEVRHASNGGVAIDDITFSPGRCGSEEQTNQIEPTPAPVTQGSTERQAITWATVPPSSTQFDCNFESGATRFCNWKSDLSVPEMWLSSRGQTVNILDHTKNSVSGHVLSSMKYGKIGEKARLISPEIPAGQRCLIFYLMTPMSGGNKLTVFKSFGNLVIPTYYSPVQSNTGWQRVEVPMASNKKYKIVLETVRETSILGRIFIDDIMLPSGECPKDQLQFRNVRCDFEDGNRMCDFQQDNSDDYDWTISSRGLKFPPKVAKVEDHTLQTSEGHFILGKLGTNKPAGSKARLISHAYVTEKNTKHCLSFFYHMNGENIGHLNVYVAPDGKQAKVTSNMLKWSHHYDAGADWHKVFVQIQQKGTYRVVFEIVKSTGDFVYGIDDLEIQKGVCPTHDYCSFEDGVCFWGIRGFLLAQPYEFIKDKKGYSMPPNDHTTSSASGHFLYLPITAGDKNVNARLFDVIRDPTNKTSCFTFWYHMHGNDLGILTVLVNDAKTNATPSTFNEAILWELKATGTDDSWHMGQVPIPPIYSQVPFQIIVNYDGANMTNSGDVSIDDTSFGSGKCELHPDSASPVLDMSQEIGCNFDNGTTCLWKRQSNTGGHASFKVVISDYHGVRITDHTWSKSFNYNGQGKFLVSSGGGGPRGTEAILTSPVMPPTGGTSCFSFWYILQPDSESQLTLLMKTGTSLRQEWAMKSSVEYTWQHGAVNLHSDFEYQLIFQARSDGTDFSGSVAIDDIKLSHGPCHRQGQCDFAKDMCGFQMTKDSDFKWRRVNTEDENIFPLPEYNYDNNYGGSYLASEFKLQKRDDTSILRSKLYAPTEGECLSLYIASGFNSDMEKNKKTAKGMFIVRQIPQNGDGTEGEAKTLYAMSIQEQRWWDEIHFNVISESHYTLTLEAHVMHPSGYIALDDFVFSTSPCPSGLSCDFEDNTACGYSNNGDINWQLVQAGLMSSQFRKYEHDHTTGTRNGHYLFYQFDTAARTGSQEARATSYLELSHDEGQCLTLWFAGYGTATLGISTATTSGKEDTLVQKTISFKKHSTYQDYDWDYLRMDLPAKQQFYLNIWVKSKTPGTAVAVDDIEVELGTCEEIDKKKKGTETKKTYYDPSKMILGCTFEDKKCEDMAKVWTLSNSESTQKNRPAEDHTSGTVYGHYLYASSQTKSGMVTVAEYSAASRMCLDFYLYMHGDKNTTFKVYTGSDSDLVAQFERQGDFQQGWSHEMVEIGGHFHNKEIKIEAVFGKDVNAYVAVDDLYVYRQPCPPTRECGFEDDGWCGYEQENSDDFDWIIQQPANTTKLYGPARDHTLGTKEGHYATFIMESAIQSETASLVTPMYNVKDAQCLKFYYNTEDYSDEENSNALKVSVRDESGKQRELIKFSGQSENVWSKALLPVQTERVEKLQFVFTGVTNSYDGSVSVDDITILDQPCHELVSCDFTTQPNFCGWQNYNWNSISWRQDKLADGATLTIPANSWGSQSILQSQLIPVFQVEDYCLTIKYAIAGKAIKNIAVYMQTEDGREYLQLNHKAGVDSLSGTLFVPARTSLYADALRVRIKAFYGRNSKEGKVNLYNIDLRNSPCEEVKEMMNDYMKCKSDNVTIPSSKVCDFSNDCLDGSDEQDCASCTFENGYCNWVDQSDAQSSFLVTTNFSAPGDLNTHDHYVLLKNGDEDTHHHADFVTKKPLGPSPAGCSLRFDYYAESYNRGYYSDIRYPIDFGTLALVMDVSGDETVLWQNPRGTSKQWHTAQVDIGHIRHRFKLHYEAEHFSYVRNVIAVDNVKLVGCHFPDKKYEPCSQHQFTCKSGGCIGLDRLCDMEANCWDGSDEADAMCSAYIRDNFEYGLGHWRQSKDDDFDWVRMQGKSSDLVHGAKRDHTLGTNRGHYLVIEGNGNHKKGEIARLDGPIIKPTKGSACKMSVFTHRFDGLGDGKLNILKRTSLKGPMSSTGFVLVDDSDGWNKHEFVLQSDIVFQVVLEGIVGSYHTADIGIDDIILSTGCVITTSQPLPEGVAPTEKPSVCKKDQFACASGKVSCINMSQKCDWSSQCDDGSDEKGCGPCSFDSGMCGWNDVSDGNIMFQALNVSKATGVEPTHDHTNITSTTGTYLKIVSGYGDAGSTAKLLGPTLKETSVSCRFGLYFYKMGPTSGQITIGVQNPANIYRSEDIVAKLPFHSLHYATWMQLSAQFGKLPIGYQPFVEVTSNSVNDDIAVAIDDVYFKDCEPNKIFNISGANCDFEKGMCEWFNNNLERQSWTRTDQSTPSPNTGPDRDHTTGTGFYLYATSPTRNIGTQGVVSATLRSALLQWPHGTEEGCLNFWYVLYGVYVQSLDVYMVKDQNETNRILIFSKSLSQGNVWRQGFTSIETSGIFQIEFVATIPNILGDIALDDIELSAGACPVIPRCDFEFGMCGFQSKEWKVYQATTQLNHYPDKDNTLQTNSGHFIAIDYTDLAASAKPTLVSPVYTKTQSKMCLTVFVYITSDGPSVNVYMKSKGDTGNGVKLFEVDPYWINWFEYTQHTFTPTDDYQIIFEAFTASKTTYPIALDDFRIDMGECPLLGSCNFEKNDCGYDTSKTSQKERHWVRNSGYYVNEKTGPPVDHTTKTERGFYMMADSYRVSTFHSFFRGTDKFVLESPMLNPKSHKSPRMCVSFWYYMNGNTQDMTTFQVRTYKKDIPTKIFEVSKSMGERWNYQFFNVTTQSLNQITFTAVVGRRGESDVAVDDILITEGDCTQRNTTTLTPEVPKSYPPTKFDCNFDHGGSCNWTLSQGVNATLKVVTMSSFENDAEPYDHTKESSQGKFLLFKPTKMVTGFANARQKSYAQATSPILNQHSTSSGTCLKFWYKMTENAFGYIEVLLQKADAGEQYTMWRKYTDVQSIWTFAQIHIAPQFYASKNATGSKFVIRFYARTSVVDEYKIDDISFNDGPCLDQLQHCDFEEPSICGFVQDKTESLDWLRYPYKAPFFFSPNNDHTYGSPYGHLMYLYTRAAGSETAMARLLSPIVDVNMGKCLRFFYYITGSDSRTTFRVKTLSEEENEVMLWEIRGNHNSPRWQAAEVALDLLTPSRIVFEGIPGGYRNTFIGIDDMSLLPYECPKPATCDFERDLCLFSNTHGYAHFDWLRHMGQTTSNGTGAKVDATTHTEFGHYMYIESSAPRTNGDQAGLQSEMLPPTAGGCLTFSYHMHGSGVGQLNVVQHNEVVERKGASVLLVSLKGDQGPRWNQKFLNISSQNQFYFDFVGIIGTVDQSDIAIDDIAYTDGFCTQPTQETMYTCTDGKMIHRSQVCDFVPQCTDRGDEALCGDCNFEHGLCGYVPMGSSSYNFRRGKNADIANGYLGKDHTLKTKLGHTAFISGTPSLSSEDVLLKSALLQKSYQTCQLQFYYKLMNRYASIAVELEFFDSSRVQILTASHSYNYGSWMKDSAQIGQIASPFYIVFSGRKITNGIPFAIDDITLKDCGPPSAPDHTDSSLFTCQNGYQIQKRELCDLADDCGDGSDESNCQNVTACDFEKSLCTWSRMTSSGMGSWIRDQGFDVSYGAGPLRDHTTGTPSGHFIYLRHSHFHQKTNAKLISQVVQGTKNDENCWLTIYYQMRGLSSGANLNVYMQTEHNGYTTNLFTKHNEQQNFWDRAILPLSSKSNFQIIIEGMHIGFNSNSEIGLDDIVFSSGCHMADSSATLPTPSSPLTTQQKPASNCPYINQFHCGNGTCIDKKYVCDFVKDCGDGSDEFKCGSCDFEKGWCGWYDGSVGRIAFARSSSDVMGKLGPAKDTTTKSSKGHYLYAALSSGVSNSPAVIKSGPLRPVGRNCYISLSYYTEAANELSELLFTAVSADSSTLVDTYSLSRYYTGWDEISVNLYEELTSELKDGWHLEISYQDAKEFSPPQNGKFALDDIQFNSCSMKLQKPSLDCDFQSNLCEWTQSTKDIFDWTTVEALKNIPTPSVSIDWDRYYLLAKSQGQRKNDMAIIESPQLPPEQSDRCLTFYYYMFGDKGILEVRRKDAFSSYVMFQRYASGNRQWQKAYISIKLNQPTSLEISAVVSGVKGDDIAIDELMLSESSCEEIQGSECTFEDGDLCNWRKTKVSALQWTVHNGLSLLKHISLPKTDHTTLTKYGYFAYLPISEKNKGKHAVMLPSGVSLVSFQSCFTFWYHMVGGKAPEIEVYVNSTNLYQKVATYPGPTENIWRRGAVTLQGGEDIFLIGKSHGGFGHIAIDDTKVDDYECDMAGTCTFKADLCGYINSPSNKFNFVVEKNVLSYHNTHAIAKPTSNTKKGDTAVLISDPILKSGCLEFKAFMRSDSKSQGIASGKLNVYIRKINSLPQQRTMVKTVQYFARNAYTPKITVDVSNFTNFEILFEVVASGVVGEAISLSFVKLRHDNCSNTPIVTTTVQPSTAPIHKPSPFDCHFESTTCGWKALTDDGIQWRLAKKDEHSKSTHFEYFNLWYDHTLNSIDGGFLQASIYYSDVESRFASIISPKVDMKGSMCFQFWYYMFGPEAGELKLILNTKTPLWTRTGSQGAQWNLASVHIRNVKEGVLSFEAGDVIAEDNIAIDDISAFYGKCPETNGCDFENGKCNYDLEEIGYAPWTLKSGIYLEELLSPVKGDHTVGTYAGWALAMDHSSMHARREGKFTTTVFTASTASCLTFWYYMKGSEKLSLTVWKHEDSTSGYGLAVTIRGAQGPGWQLGTIDILEDSRISLEFKGHIEENDKNAVIAVDDIKMVDGICPRFATCDFEDDLCGWTVAEKGNNYYEWIPFRGDLLLSTSWDHTTGTKHGVYLITLWDSRLASPTFEHGSNYCLILWAVLGHNKLSISTSDIDGKSLSLIDSSHSTVTDSHPTANGWKQYQFSMTPSDKQFQVFIDATVSDGHILMDDLAVYDKQCSNVQSALHRNQQFYCSSSKTHLPISKKCDFIVDCPGNNEELDCGYNCNFETDGLCKWKNSATDVSNGGKWQIASGSSFSNKSQSIVDHTLFSIHGKFVYNLPSGSYFQWSTMNYKSPVLQSSAASCEIKFSYLRLNPSATKYFDVKKFQKDVQTYLMSFEWESYYDQPRWQDRVVSLGRNKAPFYIEIALRQASKDENDPDILLDDIVFRNCGLPTESSCTGDGDLFHCRNSACVDSNVQCNLQDDCGDNSDENQVLCDKYEMIDFEDGSLGSWQQEIGTDEFDWHVLKTLTYADHTLKSGNGHVASAANGISQRKASDRAHIISYAVAPNTNCRFTLSYLIVAETKGHFNIYKRHEVNGQLSLLASPESTGHYNWKTFSQLIFDSKPYQIVLEITGGSQASVVVDDTIFSDACTKYNGTFPQVAPKPRPTPTPRQCTINDFSCQSGGCIPKTQVCDFLKQCPDGSDEKQCSSCSFDDGMCGWHDGSNGENRWEYSIADSSIGIKTDRTQSATDKFHGIVRVASNELTGYQFPAVLVSDHIGATNPNCIINFWVYLKNAPTAELKVSYQPTYTYEYSSEKEYLLNSFRLKDISQGAWTKLESTIGYQKEGGLVVLTVSGSDSNSIIAIDDVSFSNCRMGAVKDVCTVNEMQCDNKACISNSERCDGHNDCSDGSDESDCYRHERCRFTNFDRCVFNDDPTANAKWTIAEGSADSSDLSPSTGHSGGRSDGYLYMKPSKQSQPLYARLKSQVFFTGTIPGIPCKVSLFYYQKTNVSPSINIYTQYVEDGPLKQQWSNKQGTNGIWKKAWITLTGKRAVRIIIEGVGRENTAVAIDDVWFSRGCKMGYGSEDSLPFVSTRKQGSCKFGSFQCDGNKCIPDMFACDRKAQCNDGTDEMNCGVPCNFENGVCGWTAEVDGASRNLSSLTIQKGFNVSADVNPGTSKGHVISDFKTPYGSTQFWSPFYSSSYGNCKFSFWYMPYNSYISVDVYDYSKANKGLSETDVQHKKWTKKTVELPQCVSDFKLSISSTRTYGSDSPIILDDFKWESCPKQQYKDQCNADEFLCKDKLKCITEANKCDLAMDCCDGSDEDSYQCYSYLRMTFDWGFDNWKQQTDDEADWRQGSWYGIEDHTTGDSSGGGFLMFDTGHTAYKAKMFLSMDPPLQDCHMRLWYAGYGTTEDVAPTLNVFKQTGPTSMTKLKSVKAVGGWKKLDLLIQSVVSYKIILEGVGGLEFSSNVYVDDITFTPGCGMSSFTPPPSFVPQTVTPHPSKTTGSTLSGKTLPPSISTGSTSTPSVKTTRPITTTHLPACPNQFQCHSTKKCIPSSKVCDFNSDCLQHSDEDGCHTLSVCDFTHDMCGWSSSSSVSGISWIRDTPSGAQHGQAPAYDASFMKGSNGHFVYLIDTMTTSKSGLLAKMDSRTFNGAAASCMVQFWYFMQGSNSKTDLSMYIVWSGKKDLIWISISDTNKKWQKVTVSIGRRHESFSLEFVKSINTENKGITAIDNIKFILCAEPRAVDVCTPTNTKFLCQNKACIDNVHKCDGQDDCGDNSDESKSSCGTSTINKFDNGFSGMRQLHHHDSIDWQIWSSQATPVAGLQGIDHTTFTSTGHYAYAVGTRQGDTAWLMSSNWIASNPAAAYCKGSLYVMVPESTANFTIGTVTHNMGPVDEQMKSITATSSVWTMVEFSIDHDKPFSLVFMAEFDKAGSAVAIDDFIMSSTCKLYNKDLPNINCQSSKFECHSDSLCIDRAKRCDGTRDCKDGTDEYNCPSKSTPSTRAPITNPVTKTTGTGTTLKQTVEKNVSSSSSGSWQTPVGVVLGLVGLIAIVVVVIIFLKKKQHLSWLTLPNIRTNILSRDNGMDNPLFEYGTSSSSADFQLDDMGPKHPDDVFGDSTNGSNKDNVAFDNPMYVENSEA